MEIESQPTRQLSHTLDEAIEAFDRLPLDHPRRAELARQIRAIEDAIGAEEGL